MALLCGGCIVTDDDDAADDDDATGDDDDATGDDDDDDGDPCDDPAQLRADALENGTQILDGVTLEESTPIVDVLGDMDGFHDQLIQIEGMAVDFCAAEGCWVVVTDPDGEILTLKVDDGAIDWRQFADPGLYMVADGVFDRDGAHGAQLFVLDHGAMAGSINCL
jgi:hypothetical protein